MEKRVEQKSTVCNRLNLAFNRLHNFYISVQKVGDKKLLQENGVLRLFIFGFATTLFKYKTFSRILLNLLSPIHTKIRIGDLRQPTLYSITFSFFFSLIQSFSSIAHTSSN